MEFLIQIATKFAPQLLILAFLAIVFLQSSIDKLTDWNGNLSFLKDHFGKTFLKNNVPLMLGIIMIGELIVGILSIIGIVQIYTSEVMTIGFYAAVIAGKVLLLLLLGQRIAKDYDGAMTIAIYFMVTVFGVYLLG